MSGDFDERFRATTEQHQATAARIVALEVKRSAGLTGERAADVRAAVERAVGVTVEAATGDELMTMADLLRQRADRPRERDR
jgi:hypothetical protein